MEDIYNHQPQDPTPALTRRIEEMHAAKEERINALTGVAIWLDNTFPDTAPHLLSCYQHYNRDSERHLAEVTLLMLCTPEPSEEIREVRKEAAITCLGALGYEVRNTGGDLIPYRDVGHSSLCKSNHARLEVYKKVKGLLSAKESKDTTS